MTTHAYIYTVGCILNSRLLSGHLQTAYIVLHVQKLRTCQQIRTTKAERLAVETDFRIHSTSLRAARTHNQTTGCYDQAPAMNWDLAVSWGRGVWVSLSDSVRVGLANRN